ncbi:MAG: hypothetical protein HYR55_07060 [Acidobacteria bacterium]|nr:hypothetical protein [Acidobacteriota bacterium]MBI3656238.1 hypothetical protein [Acidobacteriota bacterium]
MKKAILLLWLLALGLLVTMNRAPDAYPLPLTSQSFPESYFESAEGAAFVLFFTGELKGNFEPCG